jgi:TIR domain
MSDVFISYSRHQRAVAHELAAELGRRGLVVWYDQLVPAGANFPELLDSNLRSAKSIVVLWSRDAAKSKWVQGEAEFALDQGNLVPVRLDDAPVPHIFMQKHLTSAVGKTVAELVDDILVALPNPSNTNLAAPASVAPTASQPRNRGFAFLSFCEEDFAFVEELRAYLTDEGFLSWDYTSGERDVEKLLYMELESKINDSVVLISVVSPDWKNSTWSAREYFYAKEIGRPVFIAECRELEPTLAIAGEHRIRFWGERRAAGFELLSRELKRRGL